MLCGMKFVNNVFFVEEIVLCSLNEKKNIVLKLEWMKEVCYMLF